MMRLKQISSNTYYVMNEDLIDVRVVVTKKGSLKTMTGLGSIEYKNEILDFLFENKLINNDTLSLLK